MRCLKSYQQMFEILIIMKFYLTIADLSIVRGNALKIGINFSSIDAAEVLRFVRSLYTNIK